MIAIIVCAIINNEQIRMIRKIIIVTLSLMVLGACSDDPLSPEQQVRDTLSGMQEAAQARSMSDFMQHVADDYSDHKGNNKETIERLMQLLFVRNQSINIFTLIQSIEVQNEIAAVEISTAMASRGIDLSQETNRLKADTYHFSVVLREAGEGEWLVQSVSWKNGWGNG